MFGRSKFSYDPFALPLPRKRWTPLKILTLLLIAAAIVVLAIAIWTLVLPMLMHTNSAPLPFTNPAPATRPGHHW